MLRRWLLSGFCTLLLLSCGEPVPVDCTPDEEQCTSETEGGFETGTVAGVAAGGAAVIALVGGASLGGGDESGGSGGGSSSTATPTIPTTAKVGVLLDSVVAGVSFETSSGLTGLTNASGEFSYQTGDSVSFRLGDVELGSVAASPVLTPVELVGAVSTADRRVINLSRFLQSLDDDADPSNGLSVTESARTALAGRSLNFNLPVSTFEITASAAVQAASGRTLVDASTAINHLHGTLGERGLVTQVAEEDEIQQVVPAFVADSTLAEAVKANPELCQFNNTLLSSGQSVIAYKSALVPFGQSCLSQTRTCNSGVLSGSYSAGSCSARSASECSLSGQAVEHGASVTAYASDSVAFGGSCTSQTRTCNNGVLSGSYNARTCQVASAASCTFNGETVAHGTSFTAYAASKVDAGGSCSAQLRSCDNGVISGSYAFASCEVEEEVTIQPVCFFDGIAINHGTIVTAYAAQNVPYGSVCSAELRTCNSGNLSGSNAYSSCRVSDPVTCAFNSFSIAHGNSVTAYSAASVDYGSSCLSEQRLCSNGVLSGSNAYPSCQVNEASSCTFNGQTVSSGSSVTAYESDSISFGSSCQTELRSCTNGTLSGSYTYAACSVASAASCTFNGQTIAHGTSINAYESSSVAFGSSCTSQSRTCSNGTLSGSYTNSTCSVAGAQNCSFNGETVNDGHSVTAYQAASVAYGSSCTSESRNCSNGSLSGSYSFGSCSVQSPATCSFNGQTIAHGASLTAYQVNSVAYGEECSSETRNCSNGTLGGTYSNSSCSVAAAAGCSFGGQTVDHGSSITAYLSDSVAYGQTCATQTRSCSNGTLSGTYLYGACSESSCPDTIAPTMSLQVQPSLSNYNLNGTTYSNLVTATNPVIYINGSEEISSHQVSCNTPSQTFRPAPNAIEYVLSANADQNYTCDVSLTDTCGNTGSNSISFFVHPLSACVFNGQTISHGNSVTAYQNNSVPFGSICSQENRTCSNGTLSGTYTNSSCSVATPASCSLNGQTVAHGSYLKMYAYDEVPSMQSGLGYTCENSNSDILCQNGALMTNMNYQHTSCEAVPASTCAFYTSQVSYYDAPFVIVADGDSIIAYRHNSGDTWLGSCSELKEIRACSNGSLTGSYSYLTCK